MGGVRGKVNLCLRKDALTQALIMNFAQTLVCAACLLLTGFAGAEEEVTTDYQKFPIIKFVNFEQAGLASAYGQPYWLDDQRIIFKGYPKDLGVKRTPDIPAWVSVSDTVMVWHLDSGKLIRHMFGKVKCVDSVTGQVQIDTTPPNIPINQSPRKYLQGVWGEDGSVLSAYDYYFASDDPEQYGHINSVSCHYYRGVKLSQIRAGFDAKPLREEHGYLYWDRRLNFGKGSFTIFHNTLTGQETRIKHPPYQARDPIYIPWENEYLLSGMLSLTNELEPKDPIPIRRLKLDGSIELIDPPAFLWAHALRGSLKPLPYRGGLLWKFSDRYLGRLSTGMEGIYVQEGARYTRISRSPVWAVSPNGCRLVVNRVGGFEVIELCKGE